jgi:hypothetical protein
MDQMERYGGAGLMLVLYFLSRLGILRLVIYPAMDFMLRALGVY